MITVKVDVSKGLKRFKRLRKGKLNDINNAVKMAGFNADRNAKKLAPVDTGRLRASIHPEFKDTVSHTYSTPEGTFDGKLDEKPKSDFEVFVGTNVNYAAKQERKHKYLEKGAMLAERQFENDLKRIVK